MDRNGFLTVILLFLILSDSSIASSPSLRKLIDVPLKDNSSSSTKNSPLPSSVPSGKESKATSIDGDKAVKEKPKDPESSTKVNPESDDHNKDVNPKGSKSDRNNDMNPKGSKSGGNNEDVNPKPSKNGDNNADVNPKGSKSGDNNKGMNPKGTKNDDNNNNASTTPPDQKQNNGGKERTDSKTDSHSASGGSCHGATNRCSVPKTLTACIQGLENGSKDLVLLIQNEGASTLKVNITIPTSLKKVVDEHEIPKQKTERINVSWQTGQSTKMELNVGNDKCMLHVGPYPSKGNFLQRLTPYYKQVTPIYGAYLLFLIALVVGGTWACCKFRKRRRQDGGIPYQELEMGLPQSASAANVDTTDGWDDGWDDDWDEDKAVKSPGGRHVGSISASGLTARSSNRDGWEKNWDD